MGMAVSVPRYTVEDLDQFEDDGNRYELLDGVLLVTSRPSSAHQTVSMNLSLILGVCAAGDGSGTRLRTGVCIVSAFHAPATGRARGSRALRARRAMGGHDGAVAGRGNHESLVAPL